MDDIVNIVMAEVFATIIWGVSPVIDGDNSEERNMNSTDALARLAGDIILDMVNKGKLNNLEAINACKSIGAFIARNMF